MIRTQCLRTAFLSSLVWYIRYPPDLRTMMVRAELPLHQHHIPSSVPSGNYPCGHCHFAHKLIHSSTPRWEENTTLKVLFHVPLLISHTVHAQMPMWIGKHRHNHQIFKSSYRWTLQYCQNKGTPSPAAVHVSKAKHNTSTLRYMGIQVINHLQRGADENSENVNSSGYILYTGYFGH